MDEGILDMRELGRAAGEGFTALPFWAAVIDSFYARARVNDMVAALVVAEDPAAGRSFERREFRFRFSGRALTTPQDRELAVIVSTPRESYPPQMRPLGLSEQIVRSMQEVGAGEAPPELSVTSDAHLQESAT